MVKNIQEIHARYGFKIPFEGNDTTLSFNGKVYIKFDDYTFYSEYIVWYY